MLLERERGQALVEFGIISSILFIVVLGLVDTGRAFYAYIAISNAARYGARFGAVVGGTCGSSTTSTTDWCGQVGNSSSNFWAQAGNMPAQPYTSDATQDACPHNYDSTKSAFYYQASQYVSSTKTTIVGSVAQRFDTNSGSTNGTVGAALPGVTLERTYVCIQLPNSAYSTAAAAWQPAQGSTVTVYVYYLFQPINSFVTKVTPINLAASSQYVIE